MRRFWDAPAIATREGLKAVEMFEAIERGEIKALWVMATNPAVSLPRAGAVAAALKKLELFVVSENVASNDTLNSGAHIVLPAAAWGEKDGTVTNSERRISRQRAFLPLPGEAKPDWWIVTQVARRMGYGNAFAYESAADIFREHAALSAFENDGTRDFDLGALAASSDQSFDALDPVVWPVGEDPSCGTRFFADGGFFTADRKARFVAPEAPALRASASDEFPFVLNTGRVRDQWHTMTRTGLSRGSASIAGAVRRDPIRATPCSSASRTISRAYRPRMAKAVFRVRGERRPAARLACSSRSTGTAKPPPPQGFASWSRRIPIRFRASPRRRRRPPRSRRSRSRIAALR